MKKKQLVKTFRQRPPPLYGPFLLNIPCCKKKSKKETMHCKCYGGGDRVLSRICYLRLIFSLEIIISYFNQ